MKYTHPSPLPKRSVVTVSYLLREYKSARAYLQAIGKNHHFYTSLKDEKVDSVSFGYPRPEPGQTWWSFTIYANDSDGFRSQLSHNMAIALERGFRLIMGTFENRFEQTLSQMDFGSEEQGTAHMILLEKQVQ